MYGCVKQLKGSKTVLKGTYMNVFKGENNLHTFTETVTANIKFCQGVCIPSKCVTKYPNSSLWCYKTIKAKAFLTKSRSLSPNYGRLTQGDEGW